MAIIHRLYRPVSRHFRSRRMMYFFRQFRMAPRVRILDVGGSALNWRLLSFTPALTVLNRRPASREDSAWLRQRNIAWVIADATALPFKDDAFEVVYSNSVIEHLGDFSNQEQFAAECRRVGSRYYVQTPNRGFPIEPHLLTPFIHWLPRNSQRRLLRNFTIWGLLTRPTAEECDQFLGEVRLLDQAGLRRLFPDGLIWRDRVLGLTKSLIAVRN